MNLHPEADPDCRDCKGEGQYFIDDPESIRTDQGRWQDCSCLSADNGWRNAKRRIQALEAAIRKHRDQKGDDQCWMDDQELYAVLNDGNLGDNTIGDPEKMLLNCQRYIQVRCSTGGEWRSYAELEEENKQLRERLSEAK